MPLYEYGCKGCRKVVERYEVYVDKQPPPPCCGEPMVKLVSTGCFDFRGSGFYQNDYGDGAHKLGTTEQAQRASVDCAARGLQVARPVRR
jgi:predicted nucleic acid-binding Zn ribbon protein